MSSSTITTLFLRILLVLLAIDVFSRYLQKPHPPKKPKGEEEKKDKFPNPLENANIDTSLDEDDTEDDNFADTKKKKKIESNDDDEEDDDEEVQKNEKKKKMSKKKEEDEEKGEGEEEKITKKSKKGKKTKTKKKEDDDEDDDEEEEMDKITIIYDKKSYQKYCENLKNQIMGNFTSIDVEEREFPLPSNQKFFSKITFFTQMGVSILIFAGNKIKDKLTMIPGSVFDTLEQKKWFIMIGNILFHQWLNGKLQTTGAFEVYYKDNLIFSKLSTTRLPTEAELHNKIKNYLKKNAKKAKAKSKATKDDDIDEL